MHLQLFLTVLVFPDTCPAIGFASVIQKNKSPFTKRSTFLDSTAVKPMVCSCLRPTSSAGLLSSYDTGYGRKRACHTHHRRVFLIEGYLAPSHHCLVPTRFPSRTSPTPVAWSRSPITKFYSAFSQKNLVKNPLHHRKVTRLHLSPPQSFSIENFPKQRRAP